MVFFRPDRATISVFSDLFIAAIGSSIVAFFISEAIDEHLIGHIGKWSIVISCALLIVSPHYSGKIGPGSRRFARFAGGTASGFLNFFSSASGPPIVLVMFFENNISDSERRWILNTYFLLLYSVTVVFLLVVGQEIGINWFYGFLTFFSCFSARFAGVKLKEDRWRSYSIAVIFLAVAVSLFASQN